MQKLALVQQKTTWIRACVTSPVEQPQVFVLCLTILCRCCSKKKKKKLFSSQV